MASDTTIVFRDISYDRLFEQAAHEEKLVFMYFHFNGCGACVTMEKTAFRDKEVADFYNARFVSFDVNTLVGEGVETNKVYNVRLHPTFLFLDAKGKILHKIVGVFSPDSFLLEAQHVLNGESTYAVMVEEYAKGNRDPQFLYDYCYLLRDAFELPVTVIDQYIQTQAIEDFSSEKNIRFIYEFALHNHEVAIPFNSPAYLFMLEQRDKFLPYFEQEQVNARLVWIANNAAFTAIENQDEVLFNQALDVVKRFHTGQMIMFKEMDGRTTGAIMETNLPLKLQLEYQKKKGNTYQYRLLSKEYIEGVWDDPDALNNMAWNCYLFEEDPKEIKAAIKWSKRSIELENSYANNDTYAALLFKSGKPDKAYNQAQKALAIARAENLDYQETMDLIKRIENYRER
jgi:thioredoxin-related protein